MFELYLKYGLAVSVLGVFALAPLIAFIQVRIILHDSRSGTSLHFRWDSDLSQMKTMLQEVEGIVRAFPVKEPADEGAEDS